MFDLSVGEVLIGVVVTAIYLSIAGSIVNTLADPKLKEDLTVRRINNSIFLSIFCILILPLFFMALVATVFLTTAWLWRNI